MIVAVSRIRVHTSNFSYIYMKLVHGQVQFLFPKKFNKLDSCIGRSLYRPVGFSEEKIASMEAGIAAAEEASKKAKSKEKDPGDQKAKEGNKSSKKPKAGKEIKECGEATKDLKAKGKKSGSSPGAAEEIKKSGGQPEAESKEKPPKGSSKPKKESSRLLNLAQPNLLQGSAIEVVNSKNHLQPGNDRLQNKLDFLKRKDKHVDINISGGVLAHLNNIAFAKAADMITVSYFLGGMDEKKSVIHVKGCWCPNVLKEEGPYKPMWDDDELQTLCTQKGDIVVGCCLVKPCLEDETRFCQEEFQFTKAHQEACFSSFFTGVVGKDKRASFYRLTEIGLEAGPGEQNACSQEQVIQLEPHVHWTGQPSLYYAVDGVGGQSSTSKIAEAARQDIVKTSAPKKGPLKRLAEQVERRGLPVACHDAEAVSRLQESSKQVGAFAQFLCERMQDFGQQKISKEEFDQSLEDLPFARIELQKAQILAFPTDIPSAAKLLSDAHKIQNHLDVRAVKRRTNQGHSLDGAKWKRKASSQASSTTSKSRRVEPSSSPASYPGPSTSASSPNPEADSSDTVGTQAMVLAEESCSDS